MDNSQISNFSLNPIIDNSQPDTQNPYVQATKQTKMGQQAQVQAQPKDTGNWFTNLLPTIGSIAAPTIGALLAPETGGLSLLAGAALSGLGGAGGQVAENALEGKNPLDANVVTSGLTNAAAGGVGGLLGKIGNKLLPKIASGAGNLSDNLIMGQAAPGTVTKDLANTLRTEYGSTNLGKVAEGATVATGKNIGIDKGVNDILQRASDNGLSVDLSSYGRPSKMVISDYVNNAAAQNGLGVGTKGADAVQSYLDTLLQKYNKDAITSTAGKNTVYGFENGTLNTQSPLAVKQMTSEMGRTANDWMSSSDPTIRAKGQALNQIRSDFNSQLSGPQSAGAIPVSLQDKDAIVQNLQSLEKSNPSMYKALVDKIYSTNVKTVDDLRAIEAPLVKANIGVSSTENIANKNGGKKITDVLPMGGAGGGFMVGGVPGAVAGYAIGKALESQPAQVAGAGLLNQLSKVAGSATAQKMLPVLTRAGTITAANLPTMGAGPTGVQVNQPTLGADNNGVDTMNPMQQNGQKSQYDQLVQAAIAQSILDPGNGNGEALLASIAPKLQARQTLEQMLPNLQSSYENAGGAQGLGGIPSMLSSFIPGTAANAYQGQQQAVAAELANSLGISKEEALSMLPQLLQNSATSANRINGVNSIVGSLVGGR